MTTENEKNPLPNPAIRKQIDDNLKRVYAETLNEALPDRFKDLLSKLQAVDPSGKDAEK
jgi:hypothetical protein